MKPSISDLFESDEWSTGWHELGGSYEPERGAAKPYIGILDYVSVAFWPLGGSAEYAAKMIEVIGQSIERGIRRRQMRLQMILLFLFVVLTLILGGA